MRRADDLGFDGDFDRLPSDDEGSPGVNHSGLYRLVRYGPVAATVVLVGCAFLAYRLAAQVANQGTVSILAADVWYLPLVAVALLSVGVAADHFTGWAVHPRRPQVLTRGIIAGLLIASLFFAALAAPWFHPGEPYFDRAIVTLCVAGLLCIPAVVTDLACRLVSFAYREYWR